MATLPASSNATSSTATEGQVKTWLAAVRTYIAQQLGANGTQVESLQTLGTPFNGAVLKTGAYTVVAADRGKVIRCTGTWTLSVTDVATLADGFVFAVLNEGSGTITVDPNLTEQVDGATTKALTAGSFTVFYCDGAKLKSMGSIDSAAVVAALGYTPANASHTHSPEASGGIGHRVTVTNNDGSGMPTIGSNYAPNSTSTFRFSGSSSGFDWLSGYTGLTGTWKCTDRFSTADVLSDGSSVYRYLAELVRIS